PATVYPGQIEDMLQNHVEIGHVLPDEQELILPDRVFDEGQSEPALAGAAMFVNHAAGGCEKAFPAALPRLVREVGILYVERVIERIEPAERRKSRFGLSFVENTIRKNQFLF